MKNLFLSLLIGLASTFIHAQNINLEWARSIGGASSELSTSMDIDDSGNVYITGYYSGIVDFNPGSAVFNLTSQGNGDVFIVKLDNKGGFVWAKSVGGPKNEGGNFITTDENGNLYITGHYEDTADFDPDTTTFNLISAGSADVYVLKLDQAGNFIWAKSFNGTFAAQGRSIAVGKSGNLYVTGHYNGTVDFDPGAPVYNLTSSSGEALFVTKLGDDGRFLWAKSIGGLLDDLAFSIAIDSSDNLYVTGQYRNTVDFDPDTSIHNLTSNDNSVDFFVLKLDKNGSFVWANSVGGKGYDHGFSITTDLSGNSYVTGSYSGTTDFDPGTLSYELTSKGSSDIFVQKLDPNGALIWARSMGGSFSDEGTAIKADINGDVYVTGYFQDTVDFDVGSSTFNLISNGDWDIFIQKLDSSGNFIWANSFGGERNDGGWSVVNDTDGNICLYGHFHETVDFDPSTSTFKLTSNGERDVFILKLNQVPLGIDKEQSLAGASVFPNPSSGLFNIKLNGLNDVSLSIYNISGQLVSHEKNISKSIHQIELSNSPGIYILELIASGIKQQFKLVKN